jgi:hypothetical protein
MARKTIDYVEQGNGRDKGKVFRITELPAEDAEEWGARAVFALMNAGVDIPDDVAKQGLAGLAAIGVAALTKVPFDQAKPLFEKMMQCVTFIPDPSRPQVSRALFADDIEEVSTRLKLRKEIVMLHLSFFTDASPST